MEQKRTYYFIGIGGIGMSALARYFHVLGHRVSGYDRAQTELTRELQEEGIPIYFNEDISHISPDTDLVVYTPAVPIESVELGYVRAKGIPHMKRAELLGQILKDKKCIAVAGSHGKTTISSLITHLFLGSELGTSAFLGGVSLNLNSNIYVDQTSTFCVVEADEYDRSFLNLYPDFTLITSVDADHLDIYKDKETLVQNFSLFADQTKSKGVLFLKQGVELELHSPKTIVRYSLHDIESDYYAWNIRVYKGIYYFDLHTPEKVLYDIEFLFPGLHNIENAVAASAVALTCGIKEAELRGGLKTFKGVRRRFEYRIVRDNFVFIDDYAHHPNEIAACVNSVRHLYPGRRITAVFQPHLYSRTRDFADDFARALEKVDEVVLLDIYPAREEPIPGVSSKFLLRKINKRDKYLSGKDELIPLLMALSPELLITFGAGDIDKLVPSIEEAFRN